MRRYELTEEQRAAVETESPNTLVVAPAGSGKTRVLTERIAHLVETGTDPDDIAVVTYTNEAARTIENRLNGESAIALGFVGTLHNYCMRHIRDFVQPDVEDIRVIDDDEKIERLARAAAESGVKATTSQLVERQEHWLDAERPRGDAIDIAVKRYQSRAAVDGLLDYDTILMIAYQSLKSRPEASRPWEHLLVDEWQDAAEIDWLIYDRILAGNRFFVGDPMQAIFGFRHGGDALEFGLQKTRWFKRFELTGNFRSTPEICAAASRLASRAPEFRAQKPLLSFLDGGAAVRTRKFADGVVEAVAIAGAVVAATGEGVAPRDFAVLTRTNALARSIAETLNRHGIETRSVVEVARPDDWRRATAALGWLARPNSPRSALRFVSFDTADGAATAATVIKTAVPITGDADKLEEELSALKVSPESQEIILARFAELPDSASLRDLETTLALEGTGRAVSGDGVFVGTIHSAKGREFDVVVLAGFEDEIVPGKSRKRDVDEERRVAYVGVTRARKLLWLTWAEARKQTHPPFKIEWHTPSRFLREIAG